MDTLYDHFEEPIKLERLDERKSHRTETLEVDPRQKMYRLSGRIQVLCWRGMFISTIPHILDMSKMWCILQMNMWGIVEMNIPIQQRTWTRPDTCRRTTRIVNRISKQAN